MKPQLNIPASCVAILVPDEPDAAALHLREEQRRRAEQKALMKKAREALYRGAVCLGQNLPLHLIAIGQKASVKPEAAQKPEQLGVVCTIADVVGEGADAFASLLAPDGSLIEWLRADQLAPARVSPHTPPPRPTTGAIGKPNKKARAKQNAIGKPGGAAVMEESIAASTLLNLAVKAQADGTSARDAVLRVAREHPELASQYHADFDAGLRDRESTSVMNLNEKAARTQRAEREARRNAAELRLNDRAMEIIRNAAVTGKTVRFSDALLQACSENEADAHAYLDGRNDRIGDL